MKNLFQDVRVGSRLLLKRPALLVVSVLTLSLGIAATTLMFSVVNGVLLRPLPYPEPGELVRVTRQPEPGRFQPGGGEFVGGDEFLAWRKAARSFVGLAAYAGGDANLGGVDPPERVLAGAVSSEFFELLGIKPALGRLFLQQEQEPGAPRVAVLSHGLWLRRFGGSPAILGGSIQLDGEAYAIVGVLPATFRFPEPFEVWRPLALDAPREGVGIRVTLVKVLGRLRAGVRLDVARLELEGLGPVGFLVGGPPPADRFLPAPGEEPSSEGIAGTPGIPRGPRLFGLGGGVQLVRLHETLVRDVRQAVLVLFAAVCFLLLITCANVANLELARAAERWKEIALRAALGATRWRVARQLLVESSLLSVAGGSLGVLLSAWSVQALDLLPIQNLPRAEEIRLDRSVLAFALLASLGTAFLSGLAPAWEAWRTDLVASLKEGARRLVTPLGRVPLRGLLLVSEVALATLLLTGAALMMKSFLRLQRHDPGFDASGLLTLRLRLAEPPSVGAGQKIEAILERLGSLPGVQRAVATDHLPLTDYSIIATVRVEGRPPPRRGEDAAVSIANVSPAYFEAMRVPLVEGRGFTATDAAGGSVIVNQAFARSFFEGEDPVGRRVMTPGVRPEWPAIVGVVGDVRPSGFSVHAMPEIYVPDLSRAAGLMSLVLRVEGDPAALVGAVRRAVAAVDSRQPVYDFMPMEERLAATIAPQRLYSTLLGLFAGLALVLAAAGTYAVRALAVAERTHDLAVRMALGAARGQLLLLVMRQGLWLALAGVTLGIAGALAGQRVLAGLLHGVSPTDPAVYTSVAALLVGVTLLASYAPARRATRADPITALRSE